MSLPIEVFLVKQTWLFCVKYNYLNHEQKFGSMVLATGHKNKNKNSTLRAELCALTRSELLRELVLHPATPDRPHPPKVRD